MSEKDSRPIVKPRLRFRIIIGDQGETYACSESELIPTLKEYEMQKKKWVVVKDGVMHPGASGSSG